MGIGEDMLSGVVGQAENGAEVRDATSRCRVLEDSMVHSMHRSMSRSGESEFFAVVRGTATALGMKSMARDYGHEVKVALEIDSVSGSMSLRLGAGSFPLTKPTIRIIPGTSQRSRQYVEIL